MEKGLSISVMFGEVGYESTFQQKGGMLPECFERLARRDAKGGEMG
jgi:hypothetical protein